MRIALTQNRIAKCTRQMFEKLALQSVVREKGIQPQRRSGIMW